MQSLVKVRAFSHIYAIVILLVLVVAVPAAASEITEPLLEKTISFKANFTCSLPECCTQCSESGMYFPVTFEIKNLQDVKAIKVHYNVLRPNYLASLILTEYEACSGDNCYTRYTSGQIILNKGGEGDALTYPFFESGITSQKYKIRAELQNPIGTTREDTDMFIKMDLVREISPNATVTTTVTTTVAPNTTVTTTTTAAPNTTITTAATTAPTTTTTPALNSTANGSIYVQSTPTRSKVFLNNVFQDYTPMTLYNITGGTSPLVTVRSAGYNEWSKNVAVTAGSTTTVTASLVLSPEETTATTTVPQTTVTTVKTTVKSTVKAPTPWPTATPTPASPVGVLVILGAVGVGFIVLRKR